MKALKYLIVTGLFLMLGVSVNGASATADEIVRKMDDHHAISDNFEMTIRLESYLNNHFESATVMKGYVNDGQMTMLTFLEPANMKHRKILMKNNDMWIVIPKVKNPIRVTASQRLMGGISYGDVARVSYADDYTAKLSGEESIVGMNADGNKAEAEKCLVLELAAKDPQKNYPKIMIWVEKQNYLPVKADFFALSGKKMTTIYYTGPKEWKGKIIVTKMFLFDQIITTKHYSMEYYDIKVTP
jgi:outer membrane lipoprotein-sorting protein